MSHSPLRLSPMNSPRTSPGRRSRSPHTPRSGQSNPLTSSPRSSQQQPAGDGAAGDDDGSSDLTSSFSQSTYATSNYAASTGGGDATNVRVYVRIRPFNSTEISLSQSGGGGSTADFGSPSSSAAFSPPRSFDEQGKPANALEPVVHVSSSHVVSVLDPQNNYASKEAFSFDDVFWSVPKEQFADTDPDVSFATQQTVYEVVGVPAVDAVLSGRNGCVFAYGQTGSGKTHTMMGYQGDPGLIPRIVSRLFDLVAECPPHLEHEVTASFLEIYNEKVRDLLDAAALKAQAKDGNFCDRKVRYTPEMGAYVEGLKRTVIKSASECDDVIEAGTKYRTTAATKMNDTSSRSHAILQLHVKKTDKHSGFMRRALLNLVDLAGSERIRMSGVAGTALKEAKNINLSLTTLRRVIDTLLENANKGPRARPSVVPYRESMLTWVLSDSLGGNCQTVMLGMMSPHERNAEDTINTLRYCLRAKAITCHVRVNEEKCKVVVGAIKAEMEAMKKLQEEEESRKKAERETAEQRLRDDEEAQRQLAQQRRLHGVASARAKATLARQTAALERLQADLDAKNLMASESSRFGEETDVLHDQVLEHQRELEEEKRRIEEAERLRLEAEAAIAAHEQERHDLGARERAAAQRRHEENQKELANVFRLSARFGRDRIEMQELREENKCLRASIAKTELALARLNRRCGSATDVTGLLDEHLAAAQERERAAAEAMHDAVEAKEKRMRDLKLSYDSLSKKLRATTRELTDTRTQLDGAYVSLERSNAEGSARVKVAGQRLNTSLARSVSKDLEWERLELLLEQQRAVQRDWTTRSSKREAVVNGLLNESVSLEAAIASMQVDVETLHLDACDASSDGVAAENDLPAVKRAIEVERRLRDRIIAADDDLRDFLVANEHCLPAEVVLAVNQQIDPHSGEQAQVLLRRGRGSRSPTRNSPRGPADANDVEQASAELLLKLSAIADGSLSREHSARRSTSPDQHSSARRAAHAEAETSPQRTGSVGQW